MPIFRNNDRTRAREEKNAHVHNMYLQCVIRFNVLAIIVQPMLQK